MPSVLDMEVQNDSCSSTGICLSLYLSFTATISHTFPFLRQNSIPYYWLLSINSPSHSFLCNQCMDPIGPTLDSVNSPTKLFQVAIIVSWFRSDQMFLGFTLKCVLKWRRCHHGVYLRFGIWKSADANFSWVQLSPPLSSGSCFFCAQAREIKCYFGAICWILIKYHYFAHLAILMCVTWKVRASLLRDASISL